MEDGTPKSYRSPVLKWQLAVRWMIMRILGPLVILAGVLRYYGWL